MCPPPARTKILDVMSTNWDDASKTSEWSESRCSLNVWLATWRSIHMLAFMMEADISNIWCQDDATYVWRFWRQLPVVLWLFNDSLKCKCKYCINGSICHFKFLKVVLAHILGDVGTFCIILLKVFLAGHAYQFSLKSVYICNRAKNMLPVFLRHGVI